MLDGLASINWLAVAVAALASYVLGGAPGSRRSSAGAWDRRSASSGFGVSGTHRLLTSFPS